VGAVAFPIAGPVAMWRDLWPCGGICERSREWTSRELGRACMSQRYLLALSRATEPTLTNASMYRACARGIHVIGVCSECRRVGVTVYPVNVYDVVKPPGGYGSFMAHFFENLVRLVTTVSHYIQQPWTML
jgi:hypothetical protein